MMVKQTVSLLLLAVVVFVSSGCGTEIPRVQQNGSPTAGIGNNTPFTNRLHKELVTPDPNYDPVTVKQSLYNRISVLSSSGEKVQLNAHTQPVLFEAYWCPHCQRTLVLLHQNLKSLHHQPILVSSGFAAGTTLRQAVALSHAEIKDLGLNGFKVYYILGNNYSKFVPVGFPTLIFKQKNQLNMLSGEHTLSVWQKALG